MRGGDWRKRTNDREGSRNRNYDAASGTILGISKGIKEEKKAIFIFTFLFDQHPKNVKPAAQRNYSKY
jgi:hypothetical protein